MEESQEFSQKRCQFDHIIDRFGTNCAKYDEMIPLYGTECIQCKVADMDFQAPGPIRDAMDRVMKHGIFGYTIMPDNYRQLVNDWMKRRYHCPIESDWILFSPRINMGLNMAVENFTQPQDAVIVNTPAYPALTAAVSKYGRKLMESPLVLKNVRWCMDLSSLESRIDESVKMFILCNPHNPTGRVWEMAELKKLEEFCLKHDLILLSDEIHADLIRKGKTFHSALELSDEMRKRMIVYQSITKTFNIPGIIFSNIIVPDKKMRSRMETVIDRWGLHNPNCFAAAILENAYTKCDLWLEELQEYLDENLRYIKQFIDENLPGFTVTIPEGTFLVWISYEKIGWTHQELEDFFINKAKVTIYPGEHFGGTGKGYFRLNAGIPRSQLAEALKRIESALKGNGYLRNTGFDFIQ